MNMANDIGSFPEGQVGSQIEKVNALKSLSLIEDSLEKSRQSLGELCDLESISCLPFTLTKQELAKRIQQSKDLYIEFGRPKIKCDYKALDDLESLVCELESIGNWFSRTEWKDEEDVYGPENVMFRLIDSAKEACNKAIASIEAVGESESQDTDEGSDPARTLMMEILGSALKMRTLAVAWDHCGPESYSSDSTTVLEMVLAESRNVERLIEQYYQFHDKKQGDGYYDRLGCVACVVRGFAEISKQVRWGNVTPEHVSNVFMQLIGDLERSFYDYAESQGKLH